MSTQHEEVVLWQDMLLAGRWVEDVSRCWTYLEMAAEVREELKALNAQYEGRADSVYRESAQNMVQKNQQLRDEYRRCFEYEVGNRYPTIRAAGVQSYDRFLGKYDELAGEHGTGDQSSLLQRLEDSMRELEQEISLRENGVSKITATVLSSFRSVERVQGSRRTALKSGDTLTRDDIVETGPRGRVRIEFVKTCGLQFGTLGPAIVNIGPNSRIDVRGYFEQRFRGEQRACEADNSTIGLLRGALRAMTTNWGSGSAFKVRVGTSLAGIRGTELAVSYDPDKDAAKVWLHHGDAFLETRAGQRALKPSEVVSVKAGNISALRTFTPEDYAGVVLATAESESLTEANALAMARNPAGSLSTVETTALRGVGGDVSDRFRLSPSVRREDLGRSAHLALEAFERVQSAASENRMGDLSNLVRGGFREDLAGAIQRLGLDEVQRRGWRPLEAEIDCVQCNSPDICHVISRVVTQDLQTREQQSAHRRYDVKRFADGWFLTSSGEVRDIAAYDAYKHACRWR